MIKIIASNIRDRFASYLVLTAVLTIAFWLTLSPSQTVFGMIGVELFYRSSGLEDVYYFSSKGRDVSELCDQIEDSVDLIGTGYNYRTTLDGFADFYAADSGFFENLRFGFKKKAADFSSDEIDGYPAVVCRSLGDTYLLGETYSEYFGSHLQPVVLTFTVVGVLSSDYGYFPGRGMVDNQDNFVYLITDGTVDIFSSDGNVYFTAATKEDAQNAVNAACGELFEVSSYAEGYAAILDVNLENNSVPIILVVISGLLTLCMMISETMLSAVEFSKKYSILYACGYSRQRCLAIHILSDLCPFIAACVAGMTIMLMLWSSETPQNTYVNRVGISAALIEGALIFAAAELISFKSVINSFNVGLADER